MPANRVAVLLVVISGVLGAAAPVVANMDTTSVAGLIAGLAAITTVVVKWLSGWQQHEANVAFLEANPIEEVSVSDPSEIPIHRYDDEAGQIDLVTLIVVIVVAVACAIIVMALTGNL